MTGTAAHADRQRTKAERVGFALLGLLGLVAAGVLVMMAPYAQPLAYHEFVDGRPFLSIPNALNVLSNLPFAIVGVLGWRLVVGASPGRLAPELRPAYLVLFAGLFLTAIGSAYYHWRPTNATLVWDRLPITVAFMGLFTAFLAERISLALARPLLPVAVAAGLLSVGYWALVDDLRPYGIVQYYPVLALPVLIACFPARYTRGGDVLAAIACYVAAKIFEDRDGTIFGWLGHVSGHTLKHLAAALGAYLVYRMLALRVPVASVPTT